MKTINITDVYGRTYEGTWNEKFYNNKNKEYKDIYIDGKKVTLDEEAINLLNASSAPESKKEKLNTLELSCVSKVLYAIANGELTFEDINGHKVAYVYFGKVEDENDEDVYVKYLDKYITVDSKTDAGCNFFVVEEKYRDLLKDFFKKGLTLTNVKYSTYKSLKQFGNGVKKAGKYDAETKTMDEVTFDIGEYFENCNIQIEDCNYDIVKSAIDEMYDIIKDAKLKFELDHRAK